METVKDGKWHGYVGYDGPSPDAVEVQLSGMGISTGGFKGVDGPHG